MLMRQKIWASPDPFGMGFQLQQIPFSVRQWPGMKESGGQLAIPLRSNEKVELPTLRRQGGSNQKTVHQKTRDLTGIGGELETNLRGFEGKITVTIKVSKNEKYHSTVVVCVLGKIPKAV